MASALAFYVAALGMLLIIPRLAVDIPKAQDGETTGAANGSLIGAGLHVVLIIETTASTFPGNRFALQLNNNLSERVMP